MLISVFFFLSFQICIDPYSKARKRKRGNSLSKSYLPGSSVIQKNRRRLCLLIPPPIFFWVKIISSAISVLSTICFQPGHVFMSWPVITKAVYGCNMVHLKSSQARLCCPWMLNEDLLGTSCLFLYFQECSYSLCKTKTGLRLPDSLKKTAHGQKCISFKAAKLWKMLSTIVSKDKHILPQAMSCIWLDDKDITKNRRTEWPLI